MRRDSAPRFSEDRCPGQRDDLGQLLATGRSGRGCGLGQSPVRDLHQSVGRPFASGHLRHEAGRADRIPRRVSAHQDQRPRRAVLRAPAETGRVRRQVRRIARRLAHAGGAPVGNCLRQHRQPPDRLAGLSRLRGGGRQGDRSRQSGRSALVRRDSQQQPAARIPGRQVRGAQHRCHADRRRAVQRPRDLAQRRLDRRSSPAARAAAARSGRQVPGLRETAPVTRRLGPVLRAGSCDYHLAALARGVRHQQGIAGVFQAVRNGCLWR